MKFIVTEELGRLAKWLRILGFDTVYFPKGEKRDLVLRSLREDRVILTRDSRMSRFTGIRHLHIDTDFVEEQLEQAIRELNLEIDREQLFSICVVCNEPLEEAPRNSVKDKVAPYVFETQKVFMRCGRCGRTYWKGTHWALAQKFLGKLKT
jgi:hypothetical protein